MPPVYWWTRWWFAHRSLGIALSVLTAWLFQSAKAIASGGVIEPKFVTRSETPELRLAYTPEA